MKQLALVSILVLVSACAKTRTIEVAVDSPEPWTPKTLTVSNVRCNWATGCSEPFAVDVVACGLIFTLGGATAIVNHTAIPNGVLDVSPSCRVIVDNRPVL